MTDVATARDLLEGVYADLRRQARRQMSGFGRGDTLQATALVHEAWLRLEREGRAQWASRSQFFVAAAEAMRRILVDHARSRSRQRHGGTHGRIHLGDLDLPGTEADGLEARALLELDVALEDLARFDARLAELVHLRAFAGLTEDEAGKLLGLSERSVRREWRAARLWLYARIGELREGRRTRRVS